MEQLGLSTRAYNGLRRMGINTIDEFLKITKHELVLCRKNQIGLKTTKEILDKQYQLLGKGSKKKEIFDNLSREAYNCLDKNGIKTVDEFEKLSKKELQQLVGNYVELLVAHQKMLTDCSVDESQSLEELNLSQRAYKGLMKCGVQTLEEFLKITKHELMQNGKFEIGPKTADEILSKQYLLLESDERRKKEIFDNLSIKAYNCLKAKGIHTVDEFVALSRIDLEMLVGQEMELLVIHEELLIDSDEDKSQELIKLGLSTRSYNSLKRIGVRTLDDFLKLTKHELIVSKVCGIGFETVKEILAKQYKLLGKDKWKKEIFDNLSWDAYYCLKRNRIKNVDEFIKLSKSDLEKLPGVERELFDMHEKLSTDKGYENVKFLKDIGLSSRAFRCLAKSGIKTIEEFLEVTENDLIGVYGIGRKTLDEIFEKQRELLTSIKL